MKYTSDCFLAVGDLSESIDTTKSPIGRVEVGNARGVIVVVSVVLLPLESLTVTLITWVSVS